MPKVAYHCAKCGKEIFRWPNGVKDPNNLFCPGGCSNSVKGRPGAANGNWKGGRFVRSDGYVGINVGGGKHRLEHDLIMEAHIGRRLTPDENVHHLNENRSDNRLENLELTTRARHISEHHPSRRDPKTHILVFCDYCGSPFEKRLCHVSKTKLHFCNRDCYVKGSNIQTTVGSRGPSLLHLDIKKHLLIANIPTTTHVAVERWEIDEANVDLKFAVDVKGCFWHSCQVCKIPNGPKSNPARDLEKSLHFKDAGWIVIDIWEHEWHDDPKACLQRIKEAYDQAINRKPL